MTQEQLEHEIQTLDQFITIYCHNYHHNDKHGNDLCDECDELVNYAKNRLKECEKEPKPKCRNCTTPCYEKTKWKQLAKVMRYSSIKLGLSKTKQKIKKLFNFK